MAYKNAVFPLLHKLAELIRLVNWSLKNVRKVENSVNIGIHSSNVLIFFKCS